MAAEIRTRENNFWKWLKLGGSANEFKDRLHFQRIETTTGAGVPDLEGCLDGREFWTELKVVEPMARGMCRVNLKGPQIMWLYRRRRAGGRAYCLARHEDRSYLLRGDDLTAFQHPIALAELHTLSQCDVHATAVELWYHMAGLGYPPNSHVQFDPLRL